MLNIMLNKHMLPTLSRFAQHQDLLLMLRHNHLLLLHLRLRLRLLLLYGRGRFHWLTHDGHGFLVEARRGRGRGRHVQQSNEVMARASDEESSRALSRCPLYELVQR